MICYVSSCVVSNWRTRGSIFHVDLVLISIDEDTIDFISAFDPLGKSDHVLMKCVISV